MPHGRPHPPKLSSDGTIRAKNLSFADSFATRED